MKQQTMGSHSKIIVEVHGKHYFAAGVSKQDERGNPLPLFSIGSKQYYISRTSISSVDIAEYGTGKVVVSGSMDSVCKRILNTDYKLILPLVPILRNNKKR
jgi:hypothetical protein